uniref:Ulp1 protease family, C-terminal catalytic domain-containing protein n=1 Tax=Tanacetum cinerariifolium TaxID=118510 RepID=A0A6L2KEF1_TANCI|nr:ulp1 protease family, C-terminal catalytic domain-containing protein [Tanacetum cinerariifolium]
MLEELVLEPIVGTNSVRPTTSNIRIDCIKETTTCSLFSPESILTREKILCAHASGSPNTHATSAAAKSTLPKIVQQPSTECSALTNVPTIIQASKKRKKTVKAPIHQSKVEKEKADIRKRLHLLKEDIDLISEAVKNGYYRWMGHEDCAMQQFVDLKKGDISGRS